MARTTSPGPGVGSANSRSSSLRLPRNTMPRMTVLLRRRVGPQWYHNRPMTSPIITEAVRALVERRDLSRIEAAAAMEAIMSGAATNAQIAAFLTALRMKGETVGELIGFAQVMRQKAVRIRVHGDAVAGRTGTDRRLGVDTCGPGV